MKTTTNLGLKKIELTDSPPDITVQDANWDTIDKHLNTAVKYQKASGTGTAITLSEVTLEDGFQKTFIVTANNNSAATKINGKNLYKPGGTAVPNLISGKAVTVWYDLAGDCFFIKASAEGDAVAANVLAGKKFSNDNDTGIEGTIPSKAAQIFTPITTDQEIAAGQYISGKQTIKGDANLVPSKILRGNIIFNIQGTGVGVNNCAQISELVAIVGFSVAGKIQLHWINPNDELIKGIRIMYKTGSYPTSPIDGTLLYDSNDGAIPTSVEKTGFTDGTTYYIRTFAYTYQNATRIYTTTTTGAQCTALPLQVQGQQIFTSSGIFTVPAGVTSIDIFLVGGGAGASDGNDASNNSIRTGSGGGGGGYTVTKKALACFAGSNCDVVVGAGGLGVANGGTSSITVNGTTHTAAGGNVSPILPNGAGGNGGSGGGAFLQYKGDAGDGGSNGGSGETSYDTRSGSYKYADGGTGQGTTTRAWGDVAGTLYAGGGGGGWSPTGYTGTAGTGGSGGGGNGGVTFMSTGTGGTPNTGGGAGGAQRVTNGPNTLISLLGGSGIVMVRWGY